MPIANKIKLTTMVFLLIRNCTAMKYNIQEILEKKTLHQNKETYQKIFSKVFIYHSGVQIRDVNIFTHTLGRKTELFFPTRHIFLTLCWSWESCLRLSPEGEFHCSALHTFLVSKLSHACPLCSITLFAGHGQNFIMSTHNTYST